ncbi:MAG: hypothetical protein GY754_28830 [bacterium]|nr:hypothetical protein [bacterium]
MSNASTHHSTAFAGLEIGSVSVKFVLHGREKTIREVIRHEGDPGGIIKELFDRHLIGNTTPVVITGETARSYLQAPGRPEAECLEKALSHYSLQPDMLLSLGGETFTLFTLKNGLIKNVISSSKCAAGTGEFLVQQFQRMDLSLEEGIETSRTGSQVELATRCSVYCKSDATHKLNKGECFPRDIANTLIHDLARKVCSMIEQAGWQSKKILLAGGIALNQPFLKHLGALLEDSEIIVLEESPVLEAFGASLYASALTEEEVSSDLLFKEPGLSFDLLPPLSEAEPLVDFRVREVSHTGVRPGASYILGVDAGSTTTKAVLFNIEDSTIGAASYLRTHGNPVAAVQKCVHELMDQAGDTEIAIVQAAVTGSGRELVSVFLENCYSFNEILTHARAASHEVPGVDTVFEIGGQDSKFISFLNGVPVDYAMNEGCSAGTGSFLEESVSVDMGIPVTGISSLAEASTAPIAFGERCAAFINTDLRNSVRHGAGGEDIIAGLVYSIGKNYISRVVGVRSIGSALLFQGGVALNRSVALALAALLKRKIVVPPHPELMGCIGAGLMARDRLRYTGAPEKHYTLSDIAKSSIEIKGTFTCASCEKRCRIQKISVDNRAYPFGGLCSRYELMRHNRDNTKEGENFIARRNHLMFEEFGPTPVESPRGLIGLPLALTSYSFFPFYVKLINELGYDVVVSDQSREGNNKTRAELCSPGEIAHGAVYDLLNREVDYIFLPNVIEGERREGALNSYMCPTISVMPALAAGAFQGIREKLLSPHIGLSKNLERTTLKEMGALAVKLGLKKRDGIEAGKKALAYYREYKKQNLALGKEAVQAMLSGPAVILAARPYISSSDEANLALPRKIISRGYTVVPADLLPPLGPSGYARDGWYYTQQVMNAVSYVKKFNRVYICFVSCFSCTPDSSIYHMVRRDLRGHTFCYLEVDSHTAHAGFETRVGAFLDIIEQQGAQNAEQSAQPAAPAGVV